MAQSPNLPPPPPSKTSRGGKIALLVVVGLIAVAFARSGSIGGTEEPLSPDTTSATVAIDVLTCTAQYGFATARISVISRTAYSYLAFSGDYENASGESIGQGIGSLSDVVPGQTYRTDVVYDLSGSAQGGTCNVRVESAF